MNHAPKDLFVCDQIRLDIGIRFYISIMSWQGEIGSEKELVLVESTGPKHLLDSCHYRSIPLCDWFPEMSEDEEDYAIDMSCMRDEAEFVALAISKALVYVNKREETK